VSPTAEREKNEHPPPGARAGNAGARQHATVCFPEFNTETNLAFYKSLIGRYWKLFAGMMGLMGLYAAIAGFRLLISGVLIEAVMVHFKSPPGKFLSKFDAVWRWFSTSAAPLGERLVDSQFFMDFLLVTMIVFVAAAIFMAIALYFKEYCAQLLIVLMTVDIRKALFAHLARQSVAYFNRQRSGDIISRLTNDVHAVQLSFRFFFEDIVQQPLTILSALAVALVASPILFVVTVPFYGLLVFPVLRSGKKVIKHGRGRLRKLGVVTEAIQQLFSGIRIVKAFGMERHENEAFNDRNDEFIRSSMKMNRAKVRGRSIQELFYNLGVAALVLLGVLAITYQWIDVSSFSIFLLALVQVYNPVKALSRAWNQLQESHAGLDRILEVLREKPQMQDRDGSVDFPGVRDEIRFENVSFSYKEFDPGMEPADGDSLRLTVLEDISFSVRAGQILALVGPSGAGKSTIVDLLARFYDPQKGRILVDEKDIRDYRYASYLRSIAIVSQDPFLFNTTIRENIRYGRETATDQEVEEAARVAFAHDFIIEQPEGYNTIIGDRGVMLSGGQRQRITIARAVLKDAQILILDEATSSLDSEAEKEVQRALDNLILNRTTFVIAHRLSTVLRADRILVIDNGRIVESGRHEELLAQKGRYFKLWRSQSPDA